MAKKLENVEIPLHHISFDAETLYSLDQYGRLWRLKDNTWNRVTNPIEQQEVEVPDTKPVATERGTETPDAPVAECVTPSPELSPEAV